MFFKDGKAVDRLVGFDGLGGPPPTPPLPDPFLLPHPTPAPEASLPPAANLICARTPHVTPARVPPSTSGDEFQTEQLLMRVQMGLLGGEIEQEMGGAE